MEEKIQRKLYGQPNHISKTVFLGDAIVQEIRGAIKKGKFKGRLKGELNRYIQNWEYYPNSNAVNFLCRKIPEGNMDYFTNRMLRKGMSSRSSDSKFSSYNEKNYVMLRKVYHELRFSLRENNIESFVVYNWITDPKTKF